jgi:hypothetical protein
MLSVKVMMMQMSLLMISKKLIGNAYYFYSEDLINLGSQTQNMSHKMLLSSFDMNSSNSPKTST